MNAYYLLAAMICLLIVFIAVTVWNVLTLNNIKKISNEKSNNIQDAKYFELKSNIQFLIGIFTVLVTIGTTVVYSSISAAKDDIKNQLTVEADSARGRIRRIEPQLKLKGGSDHFRNSDLKVGQVIPGIWQSGAGQTVPGIPRVRQFPEFRSGVGQMISGIFIET